MEEKKYCAFCLKSHANLIHGSCCHECFAKVFICPDCIKKAWEVLNS